MYCEMPELIVCLFLQDFSKGKESSLLLICNAYTAFLLRGAEMNVCHLIFTSGTLLLYKVKTQYVHLQIKADTSIRPTFSL